MSISRLILVLCCVVGHRLADAGELGSITIEVGPIPGVANDNRIVNFDTGARHKRQLYDAHDAKLHHVRGIELGELIAQLGAPKGADTLVLHFANGMQVPVRLADKDLIQHLFIAFEHGDPTGAFVTTYPLLAAPAIRCPKIVYTRENDPTALWRHTTQLTSVRLVNWAALQALLAQPSRQLPSVAGWKLYSRNCQPCHGMGGQGAQRGPDFISDLDAYRRVPPLAESDPSDQPSLHDKVKGRVGGDMPTLDYISNSEIKELWRFLHSVHKGATK